MANTIHPWQTVTPGNLIPGEPVRATRGDLQVIAPLLYVSKQAVYLDITPAARIPLRLDDGWSLAARRTQVVAA